MSSSHAMTVTRFRANWRRDTGPWAHFAATRKAFIDNGRSWIRTEWDRHCLAFELVPILDDIHTLTRVSAAELNGRTPREDYKINRLIPNRGYAVPGRRGA
jgi:hypothetical protein